MSGASRFCSRLPPTYSRATWAKFLIPSVPGLSASLSFPRKSSSHIFRNCGGFVAKCAFAGLRAGCRVEYLRTHSSQRWDVVEHVGVGSIGQRAVTFPGGDATANFLDFLAEPDFLEIVVVVTQITAIVGAHAAGPYSP